MPRWFSKKSPESHPVDNIPASGPDSGFVSETPTLNGTGIDNEKSLNRMGSTSNVVEKKATPSSDTNVESDHSLGPKVGVASVPTPSSLPPTDQGDGFREEKHGEERVGAALSEDDVQQHLHGFKLMTLYLSLLLAIFLIALDQTILR